MRVRCSPMRCSENWVGTEPRCSASRKSAAISRRWPPLTPTRQRRGLTSSFSPGDRRFTPPTPAYSELERAGGELIRFGMPAHPGSMLWMGRLGRAAVLGIASCAGFGKHTSLDLVLPFVFSGSPIDLAGLGHGGLIEKAAGRRFPPYS